MRTYTIIAAGIALVTAGCSTLPSLRVQSVGTSVVVDGISREWAAAPAVGVRSLLDVRAAIDSQAIYLCLTTVDPAFMRRLQFEGCTLWLDGTGGTQRTFGIRYPLPIFEDPMRTVEPPQGEFGQQRPAQPPTDGGSLSECEILGARENDRERMPSHSPSGPILRMHRSPEGGLVYELRIPFAPQPTRTGTLVWNGRNTIGLGIQVGQTGRSSGFAGERPRGEGNRRQPMNPDGTERPGFQVDAGGRRSGRPVSQGDAVTSERRPFEEWIKIVTAQ